MKTTKQTIHVAKALAFAFIFTVFYSQLYAQNDKLESKYFEMKIEDRSTRIWDDAGSGADRDLTLLRPNPSAGFYIVGDMAINKYDKKRKAEYLSLKPKPGYEHLFKSPNSFTKVWDDAGTGADKDVKIYKAECSSGYLALGLVASDKDGLRPSDRPNFKCVKEVYNFEGEGIPVVSKIAYENRGDRARPKGIWDTSGSGANTSMSIWRPIISAKNKISKNNTLQLAPNTFNINKDSDNVYGLPPEANSYGFEIVFDLNLEDDMPNAMSNSLSLPKPEQPSKEFFDKYQEEKTYKLPFYLVNDPDYTNSSQLEQFIENPVYKVKRITKYKPIFETFTYAEDKEEETEYQVTKGLSTETNWNNEFGITVGFSVEVEAGVSAIVASTATVGFSVEASYSHSFGGSKTITEEKTINNKLSVPKGWAGIITETVNEYSIYNKKNIKIGSYKVVTGKKNVYYKPDSQNSDSSNNSSASNSTNSKNKVIINSGDSTSKGKKIYSNNGGFYFSFEADGNLVIRKKNNDHVWNMYEYCKNHLNDQRFSFDGSVLIMQADGNLQIEDGNGGYLWSLFHDGNKLTPNSNLAITNKGKLVLQDKDGDVVWIGDKF